jgi:hypothetical protein
MIIIGHSSSSTRGYSRRNTIVGRRYRLYQKGGKRKGELVLFYSEVKARGSEFQVEEHFTSCIPVGSVGVL